MKKYFFLFAFCLAALLVGLVYSCKKDSANDTINDCPPENSTPTDIGIRTSFTEEFDSVYKLSTKGWVIKDNTPSSNKSGMGASWIQGQFGPDKGGAWHGFTAYSYTTWRDEYVYSYITSSSPVTISSWLITPVLSVKNGDKISFYTRSDTTGSCTERLQVLMNKSAAESVGNHFSSVCSYNTVLLDINPGQTVNGYPTAWTKYEYTFSGITGKTDTRIAFRHYVASTSNAKGIGIDLFKFEVN
jgi:hypothetical protein